MRVYEGGVCAVDEVEALGGRSALFGRVLVGVEVERKVLVGGLELVVCGLAVVILALARSDVWEAYIATYILGNVEDGVKVEWVFGLIVGLWVIG